MSENLDHQRGHIPLILMLDPDRLRFKGMLTVIGDCSHAHTRYICLIKTIIAISVNLRIELLPLSKGYLVTTTVCECVHINIHFYRVTDVNLAL